MARACGGRKTTHFLHFMNWSNYVFGTCLLDYPNMLDEYQSLSNNQQRHYGRNKGKWPFFRQDRYIEYYMNLAQAVLATKYMNNFITFAFDGRGVKISKPISEKFNPFERNPGTFFISFTFNK